MARCSGQEGSLVAGDGSVVGQRTDERGGVQGTGDHGNIEELWRREGRAAAGLMGTKRSRNCEQTAGVHQEDALEEDGAGSRPRKASVSCKGKGMTELEATQEDL